jgi:UDP-N-acetylmuramate-alanine ligase
LLPHHRYASRERSTARLIGDTDEIVQSISPEMRSGDVVAILSNGGFGGIYEKLPARLKALSGEAGSGISANAAGKP